MCELLGIALPSAMVKQPSPAFHLDAVIGDAETDGEAKSLRQPIGRLRRDRDKWSTGITTQAARIGLIASGHFIIQRSEDR